MRAPQEVVAAARGYLGVPWVHQGRSMRGVDCAGLAVMVARALSLTDFDVIGYGRRPNGDALRQAIEDAGCVESEPQVGALLLMRFRREPQHVAIAADHPAGGLSIVHALSTSRAVVEHRMDDAWRRRIVSAWELPGVNYRGA